MGYSDRNFQGHLYKFTIFTSMRSFTKAKYMHHGKVRLTVASVVEKNKSYLMVEEMDDGNTVINQPAGHVEAGEDIVQASIRVIPVKASSNSTESPITLRTRHGP